MSSAQIIASFVVRSSEVASGPEKHIFSQAGELAFERPATPQSSTFPSRRRDTFAEDEFRPRKKGNYVEHLCQGVKRLQKTISARLSGEPGGRIEEGEDKVWLHLIRRNTNHVAPTSISLPPLLLVNLSTCQALSGGHPAIYPPSHCLSYLFGWNLQAGSGVTASFLGEDPRTECWKSCRSESLVGSPSSILMISRRK